MTTLAPFHRGGDGTPLLLLHGLTASWRVWRPTFRVLESAHEVLAPALPGHLGAGPWPASTPVSVPTMTDLIERQLDEIGWDRPHVAGNSLGGWIALELARRGRARSAVAFSPAGAWDSVASRARVCRVVRSTHRMSQQMPGLTDRLMRQAWVRRAGLRIVAEHGDRLPVEIARELLEDARACTIVAPLIDWVSDQPSFSTDRPWSRELDCPVTIAWANRDRTIPFEHYGYPLLEALGPVDLVGLDGVGHVPMLDDPALVAHTILAATRRVDITPGG